MARIPSIMTPLSAVAAVRGGLCPISPDGSTERCGALVGVGKVAVLWRDGEYHLARPFGAPDAPGLLVLGRGYRDFRSAIDRPGLSGEFKQMLGGDTTLGWVVRFQAAFWDARNDGDFGVLPLRGTRYVAAQRVGAHWSPVLGAEGSEVFCSLMCEYLNLGYSVSDARRFLLSHAIDRKPQRRVSDTGVYI